MSNNSTLKPDSWKRGDRVLAPWGKAWLYPGTIGEVEDDSAFILFDDGTRRSVPLANLRELDVSPGTRLYGKWKNGWLFCPGTVTETNGDAIFIEYDDGDKEWTTVAMIRVPTAEALATGDGVGCLWFILPTVIGIAAFAIGTIGAFLSNDPMLSPPWGVGAMGGVIAFVATLILLARDRSRYTATMASVRQSLLARPDVNDHEFCRAFPNLDPSLLTDTRDAVATFFDVPSTKLYARDRLNEDLYFETLEPDFHAAVVYHVLARRNTKHGQFTFDTGALNDLRDLATEVGRVLDVLESNAATDDDC